MILSVICAETRFLAICLEFRKRYDACGSSANNCRRVSIAQECRATKIQKVLRARNVAESITLAALSRAQLRAAIVKGSTQFPRAIPALYRACCIFHTCAAGVCFVATTVGTSAKKDTHVQGCASSNVAKFALIAPAGSRVLRHAIRVSTSALGNASTLSVRPLVEW